MGTYNALVFNAKLWVEYLQSVTTYNKKVIESYIVKRLKESNLLTAVKFCKDSFAIMTITESILLMIRIIIIKVN